MGRHPNARVGDGGRESAGDPGVCGGRELDSSLVTRTDQRQAASPVPDLCKPPHISLVRPQPRSLTFPRTVLRSRPPSIEPHPGSGQERPADAGHPRAIGPPGHRLGPHLRSGGCCVASARPPARVPDVTLPNTSQASSAPERLPARRRLSCGSPFLQGFKPQTLRSSLTRVVPSRPRSKRQQVLPT